MNCETAGKQEKTRWVLKRPALLCLPAQFPLLRARGRCPTNPPPYFHYKDFVAKQTDRDRRGTVKFVWLPPVTWHDIAQLEAV